jgi:predicted transcriptional regulator
MTHSSVKQRALEAVATLPEDATFEDAMDRLYFLAKVERGLAQADAGELIPHDEVEARFAAETR